MNQSIYQSIVSYRIVSYRIIYTSDVYYAHHLPIPFHSIQRTKLFQFSINKRYWTTQSRWLFHHFEARRRVEWCHVCRLRWSWIQRTWLRRLLPKGHPSIHRKIHSTKAIFPAHCQTQGGRKIDEGGLSTGSLVHFGSRRIWRLLSQGIWRNQQGTSWKWKGARYDSLLFCPEYWLVLLLPVMVCDISLNMSIVL